MRRFRRWLFLPPAREAFNNAMILSGEAIRCRAAFNGERPPLPEYEAAEWICLQLEQRSRLYLELANLLYALAGEEPPA